MLYGSCGITVYIQTIFVQIRLYESLFIASTNCVQVDLSNIDCMEVVIVEWFLEYAQVTVWNIICLNQISVFFQVYYVSKPNYASKYIFPI